MKIKTWDNPSKMHPGAKIGEIRKAKEIGYKGDLGTMLKK